MSQTFLEMITAKKRSEVERLRSTIDVSEVRHRALAVRDVSEAQRFRDALARKDQPNIIAEIKRASPSKGVINDEIDITQLARDYEAGGAAAISVLTEPEYFRGSLEDLRAVGNAVDLPILRKDFIVDEIQIYEAAEAGADAILLIVAALSESELSYLLKVAEDDLRMNALVEVHTLEELHIAANTGALIIGVNNRNLHSLEVSLDVSRSLVGHKSDGAIMVAESGISSAAEIHELRLLGFDGFLIGETLMKSGDPASLLCKLCAN
jgi:indole-3-glycerol phosphate synthase